MRDVTEIGLQQTATVAQVAAALQCKRAYVCSLCDRGRLSWMRLDDEDGQPRRGERRILVASVNRYLGVKTTQRADRKAVEREAVQAARLMGIDLVSEG